MTSLTPSKSIGDLASFKRKPVVFSQDSLVTFEPLLVDSRLPVVARPSSRGVNLASWIANNRGVIDEHLMRVGGVLFSGFNISDAASFEQLIKALSGELLQYSYRSTPRTAVSGRIYTSTEYPDYQTIPLHNENAYTLSWPMKIWFLCLQAAAQGGETPVCDSRRVYRRIHPDIRRRFEEKKVMYVRNYGATLDLPWQTVFQTEDRGEVETYCRQAGIEFEWKDGEGLRTRQVCQAAASHPKTGEMIWFNQAHLFHLSNLDAEVRESLLETFEREDLPRNAYYGDGSEIEDSALQEIREAYRQEAVIFPWRSGDVMLLDNMLAGHGRRPFTGPRKVVVGMAERFDGIAR